MNVYKPLIIHNIIHSITILTDGCTNFRKFLIEGTKPNLKKIAEYVERSLMLVTALSPVIGYDKASKIAHYAMDHDLTLKEAALKLGYVTRGGVRPRGRSDEDGGVVARMSGRGRPKIRGAASSCRRTGSAWPVSYLRGTPYPRPTNGILVAMIVMVQHVGRERQARHVDDRVGDLLDVHRRLDRDPPVGLRHALRHLVGHLGQRVADVDLAAGDVVARGRRARSTWSGR